VSIKTDLRSLQEGGDPEIHERVDLRAWTALGVGGLADLLIRCRSVDGLQRALDLLAAHGQRWLVMGSGSRLVPSDRGLRVPVLNLSGTLGLWELDLDGAVAGGGANMAQVCRAAARTGLSGTETLTASPGTIGGAVDAALSGLLPLAGVLQWVDLARPGAPIERVNMIGRHPGSGRDLLRKVVVRARLHLVGKAVGDIPIRLDEGRRAPGFRQPRSAYPFAVDPEGARVEQLLGATDTLGLTVGGAQLSSAAPNCVCTTKSARASDVLELARTIKERVAARTGVDLRTALCFVDEDGEDIDP
jgi:UDP-N-acetylenolpyruvoylglucosamine reductase